MLGFDLFKSAAESPMFQIGALQWFIVYVTLFSGRFVIVILTVSFCLFLLSGTDQERFRFAKSAIELRKRTRGAGVDETVVLAFGGGHSGSAVHVTRKTKKKALYKVG